MTTWAFRLALACAAVAGVPVMEAAPETMITILHTNDIHGHIEAWRGWEGDIAGKAIGGMDRLATAIKQVRAEEGANVLLLDAGDAIGDTMIADETKGAAVLRIMNALGYDAMTIGNHEPDFTAERLRELTGEARFSVLAANLRDRKSGELFTKPYFIRAIGGVRVGILGLAYPNTPLTTAKRNVAELEFRDIPPVARDFVPKMRQEGAEIVIALTHYGLGADIKLAKSVPGIDVIVGGHSHNRVEPAIKEGQTIIVQAGAHGSDLGRLDLTVSNGKIVRSESKLILLDHARIASDSATAKLISELTTPFKTRLEEPLGEAAAPIVRAQTIGGAKPRKRDQQSPADSLFADIVRGEAKTDIAFLPGVGYGVAIPAGPMTASDLRNLVPHESKVVTMKLTGAQVRAILEQAVENAYTDDPERKVGGMIQVSGLRFSHDDRQVTEVRIGDEPLDPARKYRVATSSMLADGGHNYAAFLEGKDRAEAGSQFEMIADWFKQQKEVKPPSDVRIVKSKTGALALDRPPSSGTKPAGQ